MDCPCNQSAEILTEKWEYDTLRQNSSILLEQPKDGVLPKERTNELESMERLTQSPLGALGLELHHAAVKAALLHQLRRGALLGHMAVLQHHDVVGPRHGAHPMGDDQYCLAPEQAGEGGLDGAFVLHIQAGSGLVQQHHRRVL